MELAAQACNASETGFGGVAESLVVVAEDQAQAVDAASLEQFQEALFRKAGWRKPLGWTGTDTPRSFHVP